MDDTDVDYNEILESVKTLNDEIGKEVTMAKKPLKCFAELDAVLDLQDDAPPTGLNWTDCTPKDTVRLNWLDKHSVIRVSPKGNIKIKISAEPNGVNCFVLRDYIDNLMEQGAK